MERCQSDERRRGLSSSPRDDRMLLNQGLMENMDEVFFLKKNILLLAILFFTDSYTKTDPERFATEIGLCIGDINAARYSLRSE